MTFAFAPGDDGIVGGVLRPGSAGPVVVSVNTASNLATEADVAAGTCDDQFVASTLLGRFVGLALGLTTPCGEDDRCVGDEATSLMSLGHQPCTVAGPGPDDAFGLIDALGPPVPITCAPVVGVVPVEATCEVPATATVTWGDGTSNASRSHAYERPGRYDVAVRVADPEACLADVAGFPANVIACAPNAADFTGETRGLDLSLALSRLPTDLACYDGVTWTVFDATGGEVGAATGPYPTVRVPAAGTYTVRAAVTGLAGDDVAEDVVGVGRGACDTGGVPWAARAACVALALSRRLRFRPPTPGPPGTVGASGRR
jgi:hypothetical protein